MPVFSSCPHCRGLLTSYKSPIPTVDIIILFQKEKIVLINRRNPPFGWALPGGFVDYGESLEQAAVREAKEETGLDVELVSLLGVYSDPARDSRQHTISTVFIARPVEARALPEAGDDAAQAALFSLSALPSPLVFDHELILTDFKRRNKTQAF